MPKLIMMVGLPASGKSKWIEKQKFDSSVLIASTDKFINEYADLKGKTYNEVFAEYYNTAKLKMDAEITKAIENQQDIVWDQTNLTKASRAVKLITIPENYNKIAVIIACSSTSEHNRRLKSRKGKIIPQRVLIQMKENYEKPEYSEGFDEISYYINK